MHKHTLHALLLAVILPSSLSQPPCTPGLDWLGENLPGSPHPLPPPVSPGAEGQACALLCHASPLCHAFVFFPIGTSTCTLTGGCCFFKAHGTLLNSTTTPKACGAVMRHVVSSYPPTPPVVPPPPAAKNVLYILVDDLRPELAAYGMDFISSPVLSKLASGGALFSKAYASIAVCSPSRMSFLTGRRPSKTQTWNFLNHFRQATCTEVPGVAYPQTSAYLTLPAPNGGAGQCCSHCVADGVCAAWTLEGTTCILHSSGHGVASPKAGAVSGLRGTTSGPTSSRSWTSLPQLFYQNGYNTFGTGKVFHTEEGGNGPLPWDGGGMPPLQDPLSWSRHPNATMGDVNAMAPMWGCSPSACSVPADLNGTLKNPLADPVFCDKVVGDEGVELLAALAAQRAAGGAPFFLAVGFRKPHLPHRHPSAYDDLYPPPSNISTALHDTLDASVPPIAWHPTSLAVNPYVPLARAAAQLERRNYYASVSWVDSQIGRVLQALEDSGVAGDTAVVFHADHGWSLGEKGEWEKFTAWEEGTRVPLMVRVPWLANSSGLRLDSPVELVDVLPTLAELAGLPLPPGESFDGQSLVPALRAAAAGLPPPPSLRNYAISVYPRCPADTVNASQMWRANDCLLVERSQFFSMGVTLRTQEYRYTEWLLWNGTGQVPRFDAPPVGVELYNHTGDDGRNFDAAFEVVNLAEDPSYANVRRELAAQLRAAYF